MRRSARHRLSQTAVAATEVSVVIFVAAVPIVVVEVASGAIVEDIIFELEELNRLAIFKASIDYHKSREPDKHE